MSRPVERTRAIVCFVENNDHLLQQVLALRQSWLYVQSPDTDMVVMGPKSVLARIPDDIVKIEQRAVADDPEWFSYRYGNATAYLNGVGAHQLDRYAHILHTDVDTFITPAWNGFYPDGFVCGSGGYSNDDDVRDNIRAVAAQFGLQHRGLTNTGATWYGPTALVRRVAAMTEMLTRYILSRHFRSNEGAWPGWYRGVAQMYAAEIAINHCAPGASRTDQLDMFSTSRRSVRDYPHIHCWHTDEDFSKHRFMAGGYSASDARNLNLDIIADYALEMSFRSLPDMTKSAEATDTDSPDKVEDTPAMAAASTTTSSRHDAADDAVHMRPVGASADDAPAALTAASSRHDAADDAVRMLLVAASADDAPAASEAAERLLRERPDTGPGLVEAAEYHGIAPLLEPAIAALARKSPAAVSDDTRRAFTALASRHRRAAAVREGCVDELLTAFAAAGIPIVLLKGVALAHLIYPNPSLRPMVDVDVLIDVADTRAAVQVIRGLGYSFRRQHVSRFSGRLHHLPPATTTRAGFTISLEVHHDAMSPDAPDSLTMATLTARPRSFERGSGPQGLALDHVDMLRHLSRHAFEPARRIRLKHLYDLWRYQREFAGKIDWPELDKRFPQARVALTLVSDLFQGGTPDAPARASAPKGAGLGMIPLSEIARLPLTAKLDALFNPPAWWLHGFYGVPVDGSLVTCRAVRHPLTVARWMLKRCVARAGLSQPLPRAAIEGLAEAAR